MFPAILVAGTHSGCGKTTLASGIMAALTARGYTVQPFKVGPDFIDPTHHTAICHRPSRNLDPFMMGEEGVAQTFVDAIQGADIAVIEGVMGLYDGVDGGPTGSSAHVARILGCPVILTVDCSGMSGSVHALTLGYRSYDRRVNLCGVIYNRVGSSRHRRLIEQELRERALGWVPYEPSREVADRHLGLLQAEEHKGMTEWGPVVEEHCDLDAILSLAQSSVGSVLRAAEAAPEPSVVIGVASDAAFSFYYRDNLDRLRRKGAALQFFSPLADRLPEVDALYLGGGYPELYAARLSQAPCTKELAPLAAQGLPVYAECGGLVYLCEHLTGDGEFPMAGVLPGTARMNQRLQALGYVEAQSTGASPLLSPGLIYRGHEFHYSSVECAPDARFALRLARGMGLGGGRDGLCEHQVIGTYTHAYFTEALAEALVSAAVRYHRS